MTAASLALCAVLFVFLAVERLLMLRARRRLRHVIHVNGTRGKSSTARLIGAGLAAGGLRVLTKTTGTEARWIDVDGTERPVRRLGRASIREQARVLLTAARRRADALVVECMAVDPRLQRASERILAADIAVITNVRVDHEEVLGSDATAIARSLCAMLPRGGTLITGERALLPSIQAEAVAVGCAVAPVGAVGAAGAAAAGAPLGQAGLDGFADNQSIALEVCRLCGVDPATARQGFGRARPDPGALRVLGWTARAGGAIRLLDALASNDAESVAPVVRSFLDGEPAGTRRILLLAARGDRPLRTRQLALLAAGFAVDEVWVNPAGWPIARIALPRARLIPRPNRLDSLAFPASIAAIGNTHGFGGRLRGFFEARAHG
jgi:gamma-polyglutamate synthase